ncbi:RYamide receptor isoform X2 [Eurosta solidaginis]|uniref:RYamide receptor isoform X2 n=1 Tax=Eurosta solidaginis TaxID=178769 RepID=UPI003530A5F9
MEQFLREYAVQSIPPHLHTTGGIVEKYVRHMLKDANANRHVLSEYSRSNDRLHSSSDMAVKSAENSSDYYYITVATADQLLKDEGVENIITSAEQLQQQPQFIYNESGSKALADNPSVLQLSSTLGVTIKNIGNFASTTAAATAASVAGIGDMHSTMNAYADFNSTGVDICDESIQNGNEEVSALSTVYFKTAVYMMYIPIFVFALLGNGTVCYIVQSTNRMHTVTNYFIANLAVGDILMSLFCVPFSFVSIFILNHWPFGTVLCNLVNYSQAVSVLVSAYTLVAISIDRYMAIMWPLRPRITKRHASLAIAGVWAIALASALPILIVSKLSQPESWFVECQRYICREEWSSNEYNYYYTLLLLTVQFLVPLTVLIFTYTRIACAVWGKRPPGEAENSRDQRMARSKRKMIKMMVTVVIVFIICWLPFNVLVLLLNDDDFKMWEPLPYFWFAFHWLAMSHSCYNPIIYCYMNARFRGGFLQIIYRVPGLRRCCCVRRYLRNRGERNYDATGTEDTFHLQRVNTSTTYISTRRKLRGNSMQMSQFSCAEGTVLR